MSMRCLCLVVLAGCARPAPTQPDQVPPGLAYCTYDVSKTPTLGQRGRIGFGFFPAVSDRLDVPLAAGGARTELLLFSSSSMPAVRSVMSTESSVVELKLAAVGGSLCQNQALLTVRTHAPGVADAVLLDDAGREIDRATLAVEETARLEIDGRDNALRFLAGSLQGVHATTLGAHGILVGTGAVHFSLEGSLAPNPDPRAAPPWWGGDALAFTGTPGVGRVIIDGGRAHAEVAVEVLDTAELSAVHFETIPGRGQVEVAVSAEARGAPVFGAQCKWSWPFDPPEWVDGGWIGSDPVARYLFKAPHAGTWSATCALPGRSDQVQLTFE